MPLHVSQPPQASRDALDREIGGTDPDAPEAGEGLVEYVARSDGLPHRIYSLGLDDLVAGKALSDARQVSWRYLLGSGDRAEAAAEVFHDGGAASEHSFHSLNRGPFVQGTLDALAAVEADPRLSGDFEIQMLRIPALYVMALWLKPLNGLADVLVPMAPVNEALTAGQLYSESEFFEALRGPAQERLTFDDLPDGGSG